MSGEVKRHSSSLMMVLSGFKLLAGVVFACWLMVWVIVPTNIYMNKWSTKLYSATDSTYFGEQGTHVLIFTSPMLFISVIGCLYLQYAMRGDAHDVAGRRYFKAWKKPVLVKGPLGIVSAMELTLCLMFLALLMWFFSMYMRYSFHNINAESAREDGNKVWMAKLAYTGLWLGLTGNLCCAFLFYPVTRLSSLLPLVGLTSEASVRYHVWLGHVAMVLFTAHGFCFVILWAVKHEMSQLLEWDTHGISNVAGELALLFGIIMWVMTFPRIRRNMFELFFYSHQLYILFLLFYLLHLGIAFFCLILPGVYLFLLDRYLRFLQSRRRVGLVAARVLPSGTVELNFSKASGLVYKPLSTMFINVPTISFLQWHPFTISSSSSLEPDNLSIIIKTEGSWTRSLSQILSTTVPPNRLEVSVEGPYGPTSLGFLRYDFLVLVSGGSGISPFISIIRELIYRSKSLGSSTPSILLICAFKTSADLTMLDLLLPISCDVSELSHIKLKIYAFVTREKAPNYDAKMPIKTLWFKPMPSDLPISSILGQNNWLWLGMIISSSFVAFLLLSGFLTRYYIYPIDHNTDTIYSISWKAMLNLLFICVCIVATSSAAMLWKKNESSMKQKIMSRNVDSTLRDSRTCNADIELESAYQDSIVQTADIHYGGRPDLTKILLGCKASNTGVMASGPRGLRQDVARHCSIMKANNLHFESISFNW